MRGIQAALDAACPVPASRRADLPAAVRDLSRMLTAERGSVSRSYWRTPRLTAAYLRYFLPWNICRLSRLLPDLDLGLGPGARILDAGSGPLTLLPALWCARPDLRSLPLEFVCADIAPHPLELGRDIFRALAGADSPWRIRTARASLERMLFPRRGGSYDLIAALNVLNELRGGRGNREAETLEDDLDGLAAAAAARLKPGGRLLVLEPGTRLGGKIVAMLRKGASAHGCRVLAPCTHQAPCPMLRDTRAEPNGAASRDAQAWGVRSSGWCHFTCSTDGAPDALRDLTRLAGLQKKRLSFSFLLAANDADGLSATPGEYYANAGNTGNTGGAGNTGNRRNAGGAGNTGDAGNTGGAAGTRNTGRAGNAARRSGAAENAGEPAARTELRVLSDPIALPGENAPARYACSESGLVLLADARHIPSLALVRASVRKDATGRTMRDAKSGLPVYALADVPPRKVGVGEPRDSVATPPVKKAAPRKAGVGGEPRGSVATTSGKTAAPRKGNAGEPGDAAGSPGKRRNAPARHGPRRKP
jgi:SAM-dependent methyltransferase